MTAASTGNGPSPANGDTTGRTPSDIVAQLLVGLSWKLIAQTILIAVVLAITFLPIIWVYRWCFPAWFGATDHRPALAKSDYVLISPSKVWVNSGITIDPAERVVVSASGNITMAIHRIVDAAERDIRPPQGWNGAIGITKHESHRLYALRHSLVIAPEANPGALLMYAAPDDSGDLESLPSVRNPRPEGIMVVVTTTRDKLEYVNQTRQRQRLFFCVNDTLLDDTDTCRAAYAGSGQKEVTETYGLNDDGSPRHTHAELLSKWDAIVAKGYYTIWFDDNSGQFLVKVVHLVSR